MTFKYFIKHFFSKSIHSQLKKVSEKWEYPISKSGNMPQKVGILIIDNKYSQKVGIAIIKKRET